MFKNTTTHTEWASEEIPGRYFDIYCERPSPEMVPWCTVCLFYPVQPNAPFLLLSFVLPFFLPSSSKLNLPPSIFPYIYPHLAVWKHQSIPGRIDYCTLTLSGWTALIHHTHCAVCQQHQSIFHFHNREEKGGDGNRKKNNRLNKNRWKKKSKKKKRISFIENVGMKTA